MTGKILMVHVLILICVTANAQSGKKVTSFTLKDINGASVKLPYIGQKTFVLFYIDPDVQELSDPLTEAINSKKYPSEKFGAIGVVNCKDTWIPNSVIRSKVNKKQNQYPESVLLLDENYLLKSAWKTTDENEAMLVCVIGKDGSVKYYEVVKSKQEVKAIMNKVIQAIDKNLDE